MLRLRHLRNLSSRASSIHDNTARPPLVYNTPPLPEHLNLAPKTIHRPVTDHVASHLKQPRSTPLLLTGPKGVGKSTVLQQAVRSVRERGFITLYVPEAAEWTRGAGFFAPTPVEVEEEGEDGVEKLVLGSGGVEGVRWYDRPECSLQTLQWLLESHAEDMEGIKCVLDGKDDGLDKHMSGCENVRQLAQLGVGYLEDVDSNWRLYPRMGGDVLNRVIEELILSQRKMAVVIDGYDALVGLTHMQDGRRHRLHANCIRVVGDYWGRDSILDTAKRINGYVLLAVDDDAHHETWRASRVVSTADYGICDIARRDAGGEKWMKMLKEEVAENGLIDVPPLEKTELRALCSVLDVGRERADDRLAMLSGGRGNIMKRIYAIR